MDVAVRYAIMQCTVTDTANVPKFRCILWPANLNTELYHNHERLWTLQTPHPIQCATAKKCAIDGPPLIMFFMWSVNQIQMHRKNDKGCSDWAALTKSVLNLISISVQSSDYKKRNGFEFEWRKKTIIFHITRRIMSNLPQMYRKNQTVWLLEWISSNADIKIQHETDRPWGLEKGLNEWYQWKIWIISALHRYGIS